jgi:hypothetical protein
VRQPSARGFRRLWWRSWIRRKDRCQFHRVGRVSQLHDSARRDGRQVVVDDAHYVGQFESEVRAGLRSVQGATAVYVRHDDHYQLISRSSFSPLSRKIVETLT